MERQEPRIWDAEGSLTLGASDDNEKPDTIASWMIDTTLAGEITLKME